MEKFITVNSDMFTYTYGDHNIFKSLNCKIKVPFDVKQIEESLKVLNDNPKMKFIGYNIDMFEFIDVNGDPIKNELPELFNEIIVGKNDIYILSCTDTDEFHIRLPHSDAFTMSNI